MNSTNRMKLLNEALIAVSDDLDVPPSKYEEAKKHYQSVAEWLGAEGSSIAKYSPGIYPQGSFALGTAVRPLGDDDFDVDAVCLLQITPDVVTQKQLKEMVGARLLDPSSRYKNMIDPKEGGRRCWTIKYADGSKFHLDVLPAIPDPSPGIGVPPQYAGHALLISCRDTWDDPDSAWPKSNPKGYVEWFKQQMVVRLMEEKRILAEATHVDVEEIEDYRVRTPLQRLIQLLKRHRDERYNGDEDKPISIIITTLAARAYQNEANLADAILNVVPRMRSMLTQKDGFWRVENPVNTSENFADKWETTPRKAMLFFEWLNAIERGHADMLTDDGYAHLRERLAESYGERAANSAMTRLDEQYGAAAPRSPSVITSRKTSAVAIPITALSPNATKPWNE